MQEIAIKASSTSLSVKEYQGQRVVTFKDIDNVHKRTKGTAGRNFRTNRKYFIEGEDYFKLSNDEVSSTKFVELKNPYGLTVLTESGYMMLAKSLTDDLAWAVQRQLVGSYFRAKQEAPPALPPPTSTIETKLDALISLIQAQQVLQQYVPAMPQYTPPPEPKEPTGPKPPRMRTRDKAIALLREEEPDTAISRSSIDSLIRNGFLPRVNVGNKILIDYDKLCAILREGIPLAPDETEIETAPGVIRRIRI